ncbi:hypothetical protein FRB90_002698 [Tulasnella sp. 427]|nr:hypothetical protein FRB90_002698 [Tulasnella sp. 427]
MAPTPDEVYVPPPALKVVPGSWRPDYFEARFLSAFLKYLPFPGKSDTAHDVELDAWRERSLKIIQRRIIEVGELDPMYVLKPFGYRLKDNPCLVVPRTEGGNILQYVLSRPELTMNDKLALLLHAARCVNYLHTHDPPVVHGGLHPTQILLEKEQPILLDFGILSTITLLPPPPAQATVVPSNPRGGYYAPEILEKQSPTPAIDVFAFSGVMLAVMSGIHPHNDHPVPEVAWMSGKPSPADHPGLPETHPLWSLMNQMWESNSSNRPSMTQVVSSLEMLVPTSSQITLAGAGQGSKEPVPEPEPIDISLVHPRIQELVQEALHALNPRTLGKTALTSGLLKRLEREVYAPSIAGEIKIMYDSIRRGGFARVGQGEWKRPLPDGTFTTIMVAVKNLRIAKLRGTWYHTYGRLLLRLKREARVWMDLRHENVLQFYGYQVLGPDDHHLISPWCQNSDLSDHLFRNPNLELTTRLELARQAGCGLRYLHTRQPPISHGDIKPYNILIGDKLQAMICDFGIARVIQDLPTGYTTSTRPGTSGYLAPELILENKPTLKGDVYAYGGTVLKCYTFKDPFYNVITAGAMWEVARDCKMPSVEEYDLSDTDPFYHFVCWCMQANPVDRPTMSEAVEQLERQIQQLKC